MVLLSNSPRFYFTLYTMALLDSILHSTMALPDPTMHGSI